MYYTVDSKGRKLQKHKTFDGALETANKLKRKGYNVKVSKTLK